MATGGRMECGPQDYLCQLVTWLFENELATSWLVQFIGQVGQKASGIAGALAQIMKDYGQAIVGLLGFSFGFWRWWRYREHILHKRLAEYLSEHDARLKDGHSQLLEIIQRPGPGLSFKEPLFLDQELRSVLREQGWDRTALALSIESSSDWQLAAAIRSITRRLKTAEQAANSLHEQLSTAYSLRGAIAASRANRTSSGGDLRETALSFIRSALSVPGHQHNILLKELEAHQLRKLGHAASAEQAYKAVLALSETVEHPRERNILTSRAKRYLAEICWLGAPLNAYMMMTAGATGAQHSPGALALILMCEPLKAWERLERGDMHYFTACVANRLGFGGVQRAQLDEADNAYRRVLLEIPKLRWIRPGKFVQLRARANKGRERVAEAKNGTFDTTWLS